MRFFHISDTHYDTSNKSNWDVLIDALIYTLLLEHKEKPIDSILLSGDLINKGRGGYSTIEEAFKGVEEAFLNPLMHTLNITNQQIFIAPGNHDIDRNLDSSIEEKKLLRLLVDEETVNQLIKNVLENGDNTGIYRTLPFKKFIKKFHESIEFNSTPFFDIYKINLHGKKVGICCVNTAWRCFDSDKDNGQLIIGMEVFRKLQVDIKDCEVKIALLHHPFSYLHSFEAENLKRKFEKLFDLLLFGHIHTSESMECITGNNEVVSIVGGQLNSSSMESDSKKYSNSISFIDIDDIEKGLSITVKSYTYDGENERFVIDNMKGEKGISKYIICKERMTEVLLHTALKPDLIEEKEKYIDKKSMNDYTLVTKSNTIKDEVQSAIFYKYIKEIKAIFSIYKSNVFEELEFIVLSLDKMTKNYGLASSALKLLEDTFRYSEMILSDQLLNEWVLFLNKWYHCYFTYLNESYNGIDSVLDFYIKKAEKLDGEGIIVIKKSKSFITAIQKIDQDYIVRKGEIIKKACLLCPLIYSVFFSNKCKLSYSETTMKLLEYEYPNYLDEYFLKAENIMSKYNNLLVSGKSGVGKTGIALSLYSKYFMNKDISVLVFFECSYYSNSKELVKGFVEQCNNRLIKKLDFDYSDLEIQDEFDNICLNLIEKCLDSLILEYKNVFIIFNDYQIVSEKISSIILCINKAVKTIFLAQHSKVFNIKDLNEIHIDKIKSEDLYKISNLKDEKINNQLYKLFEGDICNIKEFVCSLENQNIDVISKKIEQIKNDKNLSLRIMADKWLIADTNYLEDVLFLLSLFQSVCALRLEQIQEYLISIGVIERLPLIRIKILKNNEFLYQNEKGDIKLKNSTFAHYICNDYFSKYDFDNLINTIITWVKQSSDYEMIAFFIINSKEVQSRYTNVISEKVDILIEEIMENFSNTMLYKIGSTIFKEFTSKEELAISFVKIAVNKKSKEAMEFLGLYYLSKGNKDSIFQAKEVLLEAINLHSYKAKYYYAIGILNKYFNNISDNDSKAMSLLKNVFDECDNQNVKENAEIVYIVNNIEHSMQYSPLNESLERLKELANENVKAMKFLAILYIEGVVIPKDTEKGIELLNMAINQGYIQAGLYLADCYIYGLETIEQDVDKGINILKSLEDTEDNLVRLSIIEAYFDGYIKDKTDKEIIDDLEDLIKADSIDAKIIYAQQLLFGKESFRNEERGISLLKKLNDNREALYILGKYYSYDKTNYKMAIDFFKQAIELGSLPAILGLTDIYLDIKGNFYNKQEALILLEEASDENDSYAKVKLAEYYIEDEIQGNREQGIKMLEECVTKGYSRAERSLGEILLNSKYKMVDGQRGEALLIQAVNRGNSMAIYDLVYQYIEGNILEKDLYKAEQLLKYGVDRNKDSIKALYGKYIIQDLFPNVDKNYGRKLLEDSAENGHPLGKLFLGGMMIQGSYMQQDKIKGEALLFEAAKNSTEAMCTLAEFKLDGRYLDQNIEEGRKLLEEAYKLGDCDAALELANRLENGKGFTKDIKRAITIYNELMEMGEEKAKIEYSSRQIKGESVFKNVEAGKKRLEELIEKGSLLAKRVFIMHMFDEHIGQIRKNEDDVRLVISLAEENILNGDNETIYILAKNYMTGEKIQRNIEYGMELLEKGVKKDYLKCIRYLGKTLINGDIVERNKERGSQLLERCIIRGDIKTKYFVATHCIEGYILSDKEKGWRYMEELVNDGYVKAIAYKAKACIIGMYRKKDVSQGEILFNRLLKMDDQYSDTYSDLLFNGQYLSKDESKAVAILQNGIKNGNYLCTHIKAKRTLMGTGYKRNEKKAVKLYERIINRILEAKFEYGIRLKYGMFLKRDIQKGEKLIEEVISNELDVSSKHTLALVAYNLKDFELASELLSQCYKSPNCSIKNSIAYMIRRGEFIDDYSKYPDVKEILYPEVEANSYIAKINFALYLINNVSDLEVWKNADDIIKSLNDYDECVEWWYNLMLEDDDEGRLVMAWLIRHNKLWEGNNLNSKELLDLIDPKSYSFPDWLYEAME